jgi:putative AbiEii toxin of type IV toxin-antitoxin system
MARIRKIEINNFRGVKSLTWLPKPGINCLIGPGDGGKSTIIDAIDFCLGARQNLELNDADFYNLEVTAPISISITIGDLDDALRSLDKHGRYLRSFDSESGAVEDEPQKGHETVLTLNLSVGSDLEPSWRLIADWVTPEEQPRLLSWADRSVLAPTRITTTPGYNLTWRRGSVLNRLSSKPPDASAVLLDAARNARTTFGAKANEELKDVIATVEAAAAELGVPIGDAANAMLDAHSVSITGGTISLHDGVGVPLRGLGAGSARLLIAGLQRSARLSSSIVIVDELEFGLEPHRLIRFLGSLGAKEVEPPLQAFLSTHSPIAVQELAVDQLFIVRRNEGKHEVKHLGEYPTVQGTVRAFPHALLANAILVCEGASEVGFVRGIDQCRSATGERSIGSCAVALVNSSGGKPDEALERVSAFDKLGYRTAVLRDDDVRPTKAVEESYVSAGGKVFAWREGRALEDELFASLSSSAANALLEYAVSLYDEDLINDQIKTISKNAKDLAAVRREMQGELTYETRSLLGRTAKTKNKSWFKSVRYMEHIGRNIVAPDLPIANEGFRCLVGEIFSWCVSASD